MSLSIIITSLGRHQSFGKLLGVEPIPSVRPTQIFYQLRIYSLLSSYFEDTSPLLEPFTPLLASVNIKTFWGTNKNFLFSTVLMHSRSTRLLSIYVFQQAYAHRTHSFLSFPSCGRKAGLFGHVWTRRA